MGALPIKANNGIIIPETCVTLIVDELIITTISLKL